MIWLRFIGSYLISIHLAKVDLINVKDDYVW